MERVWRKVNQGFSGRSSKAAAIHSHTDTISSAGFGDPQVVAAVAGVENTGTGVGAPGNVVLGTSTPTGRRLASSGDDGGNVNVVGPTQLNTFSQHVIGTASSERRRKRRKKSRPRRNEFGKPRSSGGGNILTRRLCRNRRRGEDNELYRSNSFKFERFERKEGGNSEIGMDTLQRMISVCDDYSLPIDFVKKRPSSFDPCLAETIPDSWAAPSPLSEHVSFLDPPTTIINPPQPVKLVEGYSDPKDSRKFTRAHRKNRKDKRSNYNTDSSAPKSSADEDNQSDQVPELNSPDSISEDLVRPLQPHKSPKRFGGSDISKRNPSPYYYSDLLKSKEVLSDIKDSNKIRLHLSTISVPNQETTVPRRNTLTQKKGASLDAPDIENKTPTPKRYSITEDGVRIIRCNTPSTTTSDDSDCSECQKRREWHTKALALVRNVCDITGEPVQYDEENQNREEIDTNNAIEISSMPPHRLLGPAICACTTPAIGEDVDEFFRPRSIFYVHQAGVQGCADCAVPRTLPNSTSSSITTGASKDANMKNDNSLKTESRKSLKQQEDEMSNGRTRQIYETAFDCKISRSDDDLDDVDRLTNHSILLEIDNGNNIQSKSSDAINNSALSLEDNLGDSAERSKSNKSRIEVKRTKSNKNHAKQSNEGSVSTLSNDLENIHIEDNVDNINNANTASVSQLPTRGYTPSPPSTAPLPVKFPGKHEHNRYFMNSIKSAPSLPSSNPAHPRLRDLRLPIRSIRHQRGVTDGSDGSSLLVESSYNQSMTSRENRERPRSIILEPGRVLELRKSHRHSRHHQHGGQNHQRTGRAAYSSTESMATSSSGGSMESLKSSTSEGNRSTTSSESRQSTSLSSHSSESGPGCLMFPLRAPAILHSKLHILSPISDKSSQEPASETSEINRNNISQKGSPNDGENIPQKEDIAQHSLKLYQTQQVEISKSTKRKTLPNKILLQLTDEILGSDSGISLHSREDGKPSNGSIGGLRQFVLPKMNFSPEKSESNVQTTGLPQDLKDLPFDMPKLRRKKTTLQHDVCTSGSATSVDFGDLPFDMPKLKRRLRVNQDSNVSAFVHSTESSGISQASSSHSVRDENKLAAGLLESGIYRQNLTLNLNEPKHCSKFGSLDLKGASSRGLNLNLISTRYTSAVDLIDVTVPLERQGWYHGAITRLEAESTLRPLNEGSFLVRNCESTKQDYSLSLKGAKGFMHMRIQRNDSGQYVLGQFSRPFENVPEMIRHFCLNRLPVRGAEHMCLLDPVIAQLL